MLSSLEIKNYRNLRHLTIEKLGRVNLLVGKNNTGKTSVLEAVEIVINEGNLSTIQRLVEDRGYSIKNGYWDDILKSYSSLFTDRPFPVYSSHILSFMATMPDGKAMDMKVKVVGYMERFEQDPEGQYKRNTVQLSDITDMYEREIDAQLALNVNINDESKMTHLFSHAGTIRGNIRSDSINIKYQFVKVGGNQQIENDLLWDAVTLTDSEDYVIKALQLLDDNIFRIAFIEDEQLTSFNKLDKRKAVVRLRSTKTIIPLRSMGDGINRILTIILSMVNCENGYLLIDEFENGLHYSVQEKLWEIVFYLAEWLNIQVFATTHSNDTIKTFGEVANSKPEYSDAQLIQLRNINGDISAVPFSTQEVEMAIETDYLDLR